MKARTITSLVFGIALSALAPTTWAAGHGGHGGGGGGFHGSGGFTVVDSAVGAEPLEAGSAEAAEFGTSGVRVSQVEAGILPVQPGWVRIGNISIPEEQDG